MIYPSQTIQIRPDLKGYRDICSRYGYQPSKEEYEEVLKFLLLFHTSIGHTCESKDVDFLYNEMEMHLLENNINESVLIDDIILERGEGSFADLSKEKDAALGLLTAAGVAAAGTAVLGAVAAGVLIQYLFKKGKVKAAAQAELAASMKKLEPYQELYNAKKELAALKGEEFTGLSELPTIPQAPEMADPKND
jgi:hypothetical protein